MTNNEQHNVNNVIAICDKLEVLLNRVGADDDISANLVYSTHSFIAFVIAFGTLKCYARLVSSKQVDADMLLRMYDLFDKLHHNTIEYVLSEDWIDD